MSPAEAHPVPPFRFVPETRFGIWFLATEVWRVHVLGVALDSLQALAPDLPKGGTVLDIGTGHGHSLEALAQRFEPIRLHALDPDPAFRAKVQRALAACPAPVTLHTCPAEAIDLPDASVDLVFCHQSLHHIVGQAQALAEIFRVLKPGGHLLLAESTRRYIHSWIIRLLFRHPMDVQRTAPEYLAMLRAAGFEVRPECVATPYLWWSRWDLGFLEWIGLRVPEVREETLLNTVVRKP